MNETGLTVKLEQGFLVNLYNILMTWISHSAMSSNCFFFFDFDKFKKEIRENKKRERKVNKWKN